jgi:hypothetical protein
MTLTTEQAGLMLAAPVSYTDEAGMHDALTLGSVTSPPRSPSTTRCT